MNQTEPNPSDCAAAGQVDLLSIGVLVGSHPWKSADPNDLWTYPTDWVIDGGTVSGNNVHHNVTNLVVDGVCNVTPDSSNICPTSGSPGVEITSNALTCARGADGKGSCDPTAWFSPSPDFTVNPDHVGSRTGWQTTPVAADLWYDRDTCSPSR